jgi:hypothetical protein
MASSSNGSGDGRLSAGELGKAAMTTVEELTGHKPEAVTALEWGGESWKVTVDALEMSRIPNTTDLIGSYEIELDEQGTLRGYRRTRRYLRGQPSDA